MKNKLDDLDIPEELSNTIYTAVAESVVRHGYVDPSGKTDREIQVEVATFIKEQWSDAQAPIYMVIDHTGDLVKQAEAFESEDEPDFACLFYATYLEHFLNSLILTGCLRKGFGRGTAKKLIRQLSFDAKATYALQLLGFPPVADEHSKRMLFVAEARNAFVHYKWPEHHADSDVPRQQKDLLKAELRAMPETLAYLAKYEDDALFSGKRGAIRKKDRAPASRRRARTSSSKPRAHGRALKIEPGARGKSEDPEETDS